MSLTELLGKKFKLNKSENFDNYLKQLGVLLVRRKMHHAVSPVVDLNKEGDQYILSTTSTFQNIVVKFTPGVEFDQETAEGRKVKATITIDGNTLREVQKDPIDGKETTIDRTFTADEVKMVMAVDNVIATRIYKVQA